MKKENNTPSLRVQGFEGEWEEKELGEIAPITMGQSPDGNTYSDIPSDYILVQGNADLKNGWVVPRVWTTQITKQADAGDLIMSVRAPAGAMGKTAYDAVIGRGVAAIKANEFIYQLLVKQDGDGFWKQLACGSTFDSLSAVNIRSLKILIPSVEEQNSIGQFFQNLDQFISLQQHKLEKLQSVKKAMLQKMFPQKGSKVPEIRFQGFTEPWEEKKLGDLLLTLPFKKFIKEPESNGKYPIIQQGKDPILGFANGNPCLEYRDVIVFGDHTLSLFIPQKPFFVATDGVRILRGKSNIDRNYLYSLIERFKPQSEGYKRYYSILSDSDYFITINQNEQQQIGAVFQYLDNLISLQELKVTKLQELKKALLERMFPPA